MGNFVKTQNSFANGDIAPEFYGNDNLHALSRLENMDVMAGGGLCRRAGLTTVTEIASGARLVPFSAGMSQNYLVALLPGHMYLYYGGVRVQDIVAPWTADDIASVQYAQRFDTMIFVHPEYSPRILRRRASQFTLDEFAFARNDADMSRAQPFMRFDDTSDITITVTAHASGNNYATFTTNRAFWNSNYVNTRIFAMDRQWIIQEITDSTTAKAYTNGPFTLPSAPISEWRESAFSAARGWPVSITFHQDRLVFGGARDYPAGVWMSRTGAHTNFDVGTGLDDQAIFITLLSSQRQQICTVVSSDNLQILTTVGEWAISSKPLTPSSVDIKQHTSVGSIATRFLAPQKIEGATVFVSRTGRDIRELDLDELGENYNATDLCAFSKHLVQSPVDIAYNSAVRQMFVVRTDGKMAVLNQNSALGISAWGLYTTAGEFKSVAVCGDETFVLVARAGKFWIEKFDATQMLDAGVYTFDVVAAGLPLRASGHNAMRVRIRQVSVRIRDTRTLFINGVRAALPDATGFTGDVAVTTLGWTRNATGAPWTIHTNEPLPMTIMSVVVRGYYTI